MRVTGQAPVTRIILFETAERSRGEYERGATKWRRLYPSRDVDLTTALELLSWSRYRFARSTEKLPPGQVRVLLEVLEPSVASVFLRSAVDLATDAALATSWAAAVNAARQPPAARAFRGEDARAASLVRAVAQSGGQRSRVNG